MQDDAGGEGGPPRRTRSIVLLGLAAVVTLAVVALAFTANRRGEPVPTTASVLSAAATGPDTIEVIGPGAATRTGNTTTTMFTFPEAYVGDVWITVTPTAPGPHEVVVRWGTWERVIEVPGDAPSSYRFRKALDPSGSPSPAVSVGGHDVKVTFDQGTPPAAAQDVNDGWTAFDPDAGAPPAGSSVP